MKSRLWILWISELFMLTGCGQSGWDHKAVLSVNDASHLVGGFSGDDRGLYERGVQHVLNRHGKIGAFTISQIIDDEKKAEAARASQRADIEAKQTARREAAADAAKRAQDAAIVKSELADIKAVLDLLNNTNEGQIFHEYEVSGTRLTLQVDDDIYSQLSHQDKNGLKLNLWKAWYVTYTQHHHLPQNSETYNLVVDFNDLNGDRVDAYY